MTRKHLIFAGVLPLVFVLATTAWACLWDSDTLQMERLRFPGVLEIITGKFVRHSKAYYQWRIEDRLKKLEAQPDNPALIDDLAVGYDKLGQFDKGIAVLQKSLAAHPDRYETLANLATLLFHAGRLEESKQHVQRAIEINPNAHFGREKYQLLLTEYVQQSELATNGLMNTKSEVWGPTGFATFVIRNKFGATAVPEGGIEDNIWPPEWKDEARTAAKGVMGMLHFADHQSPILLEALGDLLMVGPMEENNTQLAARAYLCAGRASKDSAVAERFREKARNVLGITQQFHLPQGGVDLSALESKLDEELDAAKVSHAAIEANEKKWIAEGADVDAQFAAAYYDDSLEATIENARNKVQSEPREVFVFHYPVPRQRILVAVGLLCVAPLTVIGGIVGIMIWRLRSRRIAPVNSPAPAPRSKW